MGRAASRPMPIRRHPRAGEKDGRHRPGFRCRRPPPRGQSQCRRAARPQGHRARQFLHGRRPLGAAQWPYDENDETKIAYNNKKRECYAKYAALADHHVEAVWVPFKDKAIPAWLHLPPETIPAQGAGRDLRPRHGQLKEIEVALYGDKLLIAAWRCSRSRAGPIRSADDRPHSAWRMDGRRPGLVDWILARPELDARASAYPGRVSVRVRHRVHRNEPLIKACAVTSVCHEPGCHTIFQEASPTFKKRFMYMSGITDEDGSTSSPEDHLGRPCRKDQACRISASPAKRRN